MAKDYILEKRKFVIGGIAISIVLIYLIRLFVLQITTDDYKKNADSNAFLNKIQYPSRGAIYDRTGKLLVFNQPAYDITIVPKEIENLDTLDLCQSLNITRAQFLKIMSDIKATKLKQLFLKDTTFFRRKLRHKQLVGIAGIPRIAATVFHIAHNFEKLRTGDIQRLA